MNPWGIERYSLPTPPVPQGWHLLATNQRRVWGYSWFHLQQQTRYHFTRSCLIQAEKYWRLCHSGQASQNSQHVSIYNHGGVQVRIESLLAPPKELQTRENYIFIPIFVISGILTQFLDPRFKSLKSDHLRLEIFYIKKINIMRDLSKGARYFVQAPTLSRGNWAITPLNLTLAHIDDGVMLLYRLAF